MARMNQFYLSLWKYSCLAAIALLVACGSPTQDNLAKIKNDMTPAEVESILGKPTSSNTQKMGAIETVTYEYKKGDLPLVTIVFVQGKLISKSGSFEQ